MVPECLQSGFIGVKGDGGMVTTGAIRHAKLQSNRHRQQTDAQLFTGLDGLPVEQSTVSEH